MHIHVCVAWCEGHAVGLVLFFILCLSLSTVNLMPTTPIVEERPFQAADGGAGVALGKSRKRVFPVPHTQEPNPISEAYGYCNIPNHTEQAWEGETCTHKNKIYLM